MACSHAQVYYYLLLIGIAAAFVAVMSFFLGYSGRRLRCRGRGFPPGPPGLPVIGNLLAMDQFTHRGLAKLAKVHGGFFHLPIGFANVFVVSSPETAREILQEQASVFSHRPVTAAMAYVSYDLADMAFARYGPFWRQMRKLCVVKLFSRGRDQSWRTVRAEVDGLVRSLAEQEEGAVASVGELAFKFATNTTLRAAFGARSQDDEAEFVAIIRELSQTFLAFNVADFIPFVGFLDLNGINRRTRGARHALDVFIDRIIDEHVARWGNGDVSAADMVDDMIAYLAETPGRDTREDGVELKDLRLTRENIKGLIMDIMFGGTETIAATLEWGMVELLRSPGELERAQDELARVVGLHRKVDESDVDKLPYLRCICKEVLRLHPPLPLLLRECLQDCAVGGHVVPRNSRVWINIWAMGRDERHWEDADEFRPSRFAGDLSSGAGDDDFWYLPFGHGRRSCPGMQLGTYALELGLANLLHCFRWSLPDGVAPSDLDVGDVFGLTAPRAQRLLAVPWPRLSCPLF
ncbi:cytochrome P450 84A1-like [Miscanthus floridulus]|uniref:cytochrome P450 84A1-like n=1 Tax=Miscanthus floridulus TaxID=154761 RepID=UPI00345A1EE5